MSASSLTPPGAMNADPDPEVITRLLAIEATLTERLRPRRLDAPAANPLEQVAAGFAVLHAVYAAKLRSLAATLRQALVTREFLAYASAGRMLIEHMAILIYYGRDKIEPLLSNGELATLSDADAVALAEVLDQFLSGRRHDWMDIAAQIPTHLLARREPRQQVNILTCLRKWARRDPEIEDVYSLFCDMVHPNVGSLLLFLHRDGDSLIVADPHRASVAEAVVAQTAPRLLAILERCPEALDQLQRVAGEATRAAAFPPRS